MKPATADLHGAGGAPVGAQHDLGIEQGHQRVEVAATGRGEERVDDLVLAGQVGVGGRRR